MKTTLSSSQISQFQRDGFVVLEGLLDESELHTWREVVEEAVD